MNRARRAFRAERRRPAGPGGTDAARGPAPEPHPAAARPRRGDSPYHPDSPPEARSEPPRGRARDRGSLRKGGAPRPRKPLVRTAAAARRAAAGALLLLAGALGFLGSAEAQTGPLALNVDPIAGDDTVNIAEHEAGFAISGDTGAEVGAEVTVTVGGTALPATTSSGANPATWSVTVPANAAYINGTSVPVSVRATKAGFDFPSLVTRDIAVDLIAPSLTYEHLNFAVPTTLQVGRFIVAMVPSTFFGPQGIASYSETGLPSGLTFSAHGIIQGAPDTANPASTVATVTVTDTAGNSDTVSITFPPVDRGIQSLSRFQYTPDTVTLSDPPTLTAPTGTPGAVSYSAMPETVCMVDAMSGALTLVGLGECEVTATAAETDDYLGAMLTRTVIVQLPPLELNVDDDIAGDDTVNIAEKEAGFAITGDTGSEAGG